MNKFLHLKTSSGRIFKVCVVTWLFVMQFNTTYAQWLANPVVTPNPVCAGSNITVSFTAKNGNGTPDYFTSTTWYAVYLSKPAVLAPFGDSTVYTYNVQSASTPPASSNGAEALISLSLALPSNLVASNNYSVFVLLGSPISTPTSLQSGAVRSPVFTVNATSGAAVIPNTTIFRDQSINIGTLSASIPFNTYSWTSNPAGFSSNSYNPVVSPTQATTYTLVESAGACGNASNSVTISVKDNLLIEKSVSGAYPVKPGDLVTYNVHYANLNTGSTAQNVIIRDSLPASTLFTYQTATSSPTYTTIPPLLSWSTISSMAAGATGAGDFTVQGRIGQPGTALGYDPLGYYISSGASTQTIINKVAIQNSITPSVTDTATIVVSQFCDIDMPVRDTGRIHTSTSSNFFYLLEVTNTGNINDRFTLTRDQNYGDVSINLTGFQDLSGNPITVTPWLAPGATYQYLVAFSTPGGTQPNKWNYSRIRAASAVCGISDTTLVNTFVYQGQQPDGANMLVTKTAVVSSVNNTLISSITAGQSFSYLVTARNQAGNAAKDILFRDTIPQNLIYNGTSNGTGFNMSYDGATRVLTAFYPVNNYRNTDPPLSFHINVTSTCLNVPQVVNRIYIGNSRGDSDPTNDIGTSTVTVLPNVNAPAAQSLTFCQGVGQTISIPDPGNPISVKWYSTSSGGTAFLSNSLTYTPSPALNSNITYYVSQYRTNDPTCESNRQPINIVVTPNFDITAEPGDSLTCGTYASFTLSTNLATGLTYSWFQSVDNGITWTVLSNNTTYSGVNTRSLQVLAANVLDGYLYRCEIKSGSCFTKYSVPAKVIKKPLNTWLGVNTNWMDPQNWCPGVPSASTDVIIPNGSINYPLITSTGPVARHITIGTTAKVEISTTGRLEVYGDVMNSGTLNNEGTIALLGNTLNTTFPGAAGNITNMSVLEFNKPGAAITLNKPVTIQTELRPLAGIFQLSESSITLQSNAIKTAFVSAVGANADFSYGTNGRFVVERYISQTRKWQLLSVPADTENRTIRSTWQEDGTNTPGLGVNITGPGGGNGLDGPSVTASMKFYNPAADDFTPVTNTISTQLKKPEGYFLYVYGDRNTTAYGGQGNPTKLRSTGKLYIGRAGAQNPPNATLVGANPYSWLMVGNPFASPIDFELWRNGNANIANYLTVWDPSVAGPDGFASGVYQTITFNPTTITVTPGGGYYPTNSPKSSGYIQSGQAFFIERSAAVSIDQPFLESHKVSNSRLTNRETPESEAAIKMFSSFIYQNDFMQDGNRVIISNDYSNDLDANDASKLTNPTVSFGMDRGTKWLSVETRNSIQAGDTIHYSMGGLWENNYRLAFAPVNMANPLLKAELVDRYTNTKIEISLSDSSFVNVTMDNNPASRAYNRFYLVFSNSNIIVLPVTFIDVKAIRNTDRSINVQWKVANEVNIQRYEVQRSADGLNFTGILNNEASNSNNYTKTDLSPLAFDNFYRIKAIGTAGDITYSKTVKVSPEKGAPAIVISPNPVKNGEMNMQLHNIPAGAYSVEIINAAGQLVHSGRINLTANSYSDTMKVNAISSGLYHVSIRNAAQEIVFKETVMFE